MARVIIQNPIPAKRPRVTHDVDGRARHRCRICGARVFGRNGSICLDCLSMKICLKAKPDQGEEARE